MKGTRKTCRTCLLEKDTTHFYVKSKKSGTFRSECKPCYSASSAARFRSPESTEARKKAWRKHQRFKLYGITEQDYADMVDEQEGRCLICATPSDNLYIDHCHTSQEVRGLLCLTCNSGLGFFKDNEEYLGRAIEYLRIRRGGERT